jgi:hypothetical protein
MTPACTVLPQGKRAKLLAPAKTRVTRAAAYWPTFGGEAPCHLRRAILPFANAALFEDRHGGGHATEAEVTGGIATDQTADMGNSSRPYLRAMVRITTQSRSCEPMAQPIKYGTNMISSRSSQ